MESGSLVLGAAETRGTFLMAQLLVLRSLPQLHLVRVGVHRLEHCFGHFLLPALRNHQGKVLVELLVAIQQLVGREEEGFASRTTPWFASDTQLVRSTSRSKPAR